ncbi:MAG: hypothetical protein ACYC4S_14170 [Rhodoferax sp.]
MISKATSRLELASWAAGLISVVVASITATSAFNFGKDIASTRVDPKVLLAVQSEAKTLQQEVATLKASMASIQAASASAPISPTEVGRKVTANAAQLADVSTRLQRLEQAILATPAKALEIPLIQRDIEAIKQAQITSTAALKDSVDRVYDQNKWLLGGVSVSILALGLSAFLRAKASKE